MTCTALNETVYLNLQAAARRLVARERPGHPLQPEALIHEAWIRLAAAGERRWNEPGHFQAAAFWHMRHILIDHGRRRRTPKHGANQRVGLEYALNVSAAAPENPDLNEALKELARQYPDAARVVEMRYFNGMTDPEIADAMHCSARTVGRLSQFSRKWLKDWIG